MQFIHLHTHSHYSLLDGLAKIDDLILKAKELEMDSLALTDHGNLYGAVEFYKKAIKAGIKPILGMEAYVAIGSRFDRQLLKNSTNGSRAKENYYHLTLLAENQTGWKNLIKISTLAHLEGFYYKPRADKELLEKHHEGLIAMSGCLGGEIPQLILNNRMKEAEDAAKWYQNIFGENNFYLEIGFHPNIKEIEKANKGLVEIGRKFNIPIIATQDIHYINPSDADCHDILLAVQTGNKVDDAERLSMKEDDFSMRSAEEMTEAFKGFPEAIENTVKIAQRCNVSLELGKTLLPKFPVPENETPFSYLEKLIKENLPKRFSETTEEINNRLDYELEVIKKTDFADYFLIVQDFINWAKSHGIVVGPGRGSAAGSLISYVLGITDVDPLKYDLLFERFLNPDRIQMPDIDIDFTDVRRDEVVSYVRQKYGDDCVAQIITFGTMAARAAIRDAGRALGIAYSFCDQVAKLIPFQMNLEKAINNVDELRKLYGENPDAKKLLDAAKKLEGVARHASVHACGVVIAPEPLINFLPLQRAPQNDNIVITQFEMHSIESMGLLKMDFLGLKNLTVIESTLRLVKDSKGEDVKISEIPLDDKRTFEILQNGNTTGIFQLESSGMRRYLKELKPHEFEDIVAMVALYRPGPMELIPQYINRKFGKEKVAYTHPLLEPIMKKTYGIGIYQEQMMKIARDLAGFTLAEADTLRKAIGKKIKELLDAQKEKLINGMIKNGIEEKIAHKIWDLFPPFARYGFNRSHSVCYALIGYQTAYLKAHYPIEFTTALFNSDSGDMERMSFLISEAKKTGIEILPPDINQSFVDFAPEEENIRFGLLAIKNVGVNIVEAIIDERQRKGMFMGIEDFLSRIQHKDLNKKSLESLVKTGVFDSLGIGRGKLLGNLDEILRYSQNSKKNGKSSQNDLFGGNYIARLNLKEYPPASKKDKLQWEKELLGLYISDHPLNDHKPKLALYKTKPIKELLSLEKQKNNGIHRIAGIITKIQKIITKAGKPMAFVRLQDFDDGLEMVIFSDIFAKNPLLWRENNAVIAEGKISWNDNEPKFICQGAIELV